MKLYKSLLMTVGVASLISTAVQAEPLVNAGVVGLALANRNIKADDSGSGYTLQDTINGSYSFAVMDNMSIQLDAVREAFAGASADEDVKENTALSLHASYRDPEMGLLGVYTGNSRSSLNHYDLYEMQYWGVEGQFYQPSYTVYAQAARGNKTNGDGEFEGFDNGYNYRGAFRYFISDDIVIQPSFEKGRTSRYIDSEDEGHFYIREINAEMRLLKSMPLYGKVTYRESEYNSLIGENDHLIERVYGFGVNYYFGVKSLKENDRYGATLETPMLPIRANAFAELTD